MLSRLRKEPVLFVVVLLLAAWIWKGREPAELSRSATAESLPYEAPPEVRVVLADPRDAIVPGKEQFREPTEAIPLPPRQMPFPPLPDLPVVMPPLPAGQEAGAMEQLRVAVGPVQPHDFAGAGSDGDRVDEQGGAGAAVDQPVDPEPVDPEPVDPERRDPGAGSAGNVGAAQDQDIPIDVLNQRFDRLYLKTGGPPFYGVILNADKLDYVGRKTFFEPIEIQLASRRTGKLLDNIFKADDPEKIDHVELADSLENRIALRKRTMVDGPAGVDARIAFLEDLLRDARESPWVYQEAEAQANELVKALPEGDERGYLWRLRTLRAQGDVAREFDLYRGLTGALADSAFRWREQGRLEARLTLWFDADEHLKLAVERAPNDARSLGALAQFMLDTGREVEALPYSRRAMQHVTTVHPPKDRAEIQRTQVEVALALGMLDEAQTEVGRMGQSDEPGEVDYLRGAVAYARGGEAIEAALAAFETAARESPRFDAVLGIGLCHLRTGAWDRAYEALTRVRDEAPTLRARALAGLALLYEFTGHDAESRDALVQAEQVDPRDAYVLYLAGRRQRLDGDYDAAIQTLRRCFALRDDLAEGFAEAAYSLYLRSTKESGGSDLLAAAVRFGTRLVELDGGVDAAYLPYVELQAYLLGRVGDPNGTRTTLQAGARRDSEFCHAGLALFDYSLNRTKEARARLATMIGEVGLSDAIRNFANLTLARIDEHSSKEQVRDNFDRAARGGFWNVEGQPRGWRMELGQIRFQGETGNLDEASSVFREVRTGAFRSVAVTMQLHDAAATTQFAGLVIRRSAEGRNPFAVRLGLRRRGASGTVPEVHIQDGAPQPDENQDPIQLAGVLGDLDPAQPQRLEIRAIPPEAGADSTGNQMGLEVYWNDVLVHTVERLKTVNLRDAQSLRTELVVQGRPVDVGFDDYRLIRQKE